MNEDYQQLINEAMASSNGIVRIWVKDLGKALAHNEDIQSQILDKEKKINDTKRQLELQIAENHALEDAVKKGLKANEETNAKLKCVLEEKEKLNREIAEQKVQIQKNIQDYKDSEVKTAELSAVLDQRRTTKNKLDSAKKEFRSLTCNLQELQAKIDQLDAEGKSALEYIEKSEPLTEDLENAEKSLGEFVQKIWKMLPEDSFDRIFPGNVSQQ